jgi:hypothetical protein
MAQNDTSLLTDFAGRPSKPLGKDPYGQVTPIEHWSNWPEQSQDFNQTEAEYS